jgi:hypothetical protein
MDRAQELAYEADPCAQKTQIGRQKFRENRASRYSPSLAVALNWGTGSSSLKAEVKAFERLHIVRGRNSSYFGSFPPIWRKDEAGH